MISTVSNEVKPARRKPNFVFMFLFAISLTLNIGLAAAALMAPDARTSARYGYGKDESPDLTEIWSFGRGDVKVARIAVDGVIQRGLSGGGLFGGGMDMVESVLRQIRAATLDSDVRGILLEIDSPGGAVTPSDEIYDALQRFRASGEGRTVVAFCRGLAASGGYYVAMASDWVIAEPTAIVGSIGVIMETVNWNVLTQRIGIDATTIKSGDNKDLLNPFRPVDTNHVTILQTMVDQIHDRFRSIVATGRKMDADRARDLADGRVFTAEAARENGLVDEIGYWDEAVARMAERLEAEAVRVVRYEEGGTFFSRMMELRAPGWTGPLSGLRDPRPMFLWRP